MALAGRQFFFFFFVRVELSKSEGNSSFESICNGTP